MRRRKVGNITLGIVLIAVGISIFLSNTQGIDYFNLLFKWWPFILILLGIEVLLSYLFVSQENQPHFSGGGVFLIIIILIFCFAGGILTQTAGNITGIPFPMWESFYNESSTKSFELADNNIEIIQNIPGNIEVTKGADKTSVVARISYRQSRNNTEDFLNDLFKLENGKFTVENPNNILHNVKVDLIVKIPDHLSLSIISRVGSVKISDTNVNLKIVSDVGSVNLNNIAGLFDIDSKVGSVDVNTDKMITGDSKITSATGSIHLNLSKDQSGFIDAKVKTGSLHSTVGNVIKNGTTSTLSANLGSSIPKFTISSNLGSIDISN